MKVSILIIGDEILSGDTFDTNSDFACKLLTENGFTVFQKLTVGDREKEIAQALEYLLQGAALVITTGGLGPTKDDITKKVFTDFFNTQLIHNESVAQSLRERFARMNREVNKLTETQAMVPEHAEVFINPVGTAPLFWFKKDDKNVITLPGVPQEMRHLLENIFMPLIVERFSTGKILIIN